MVGVLVLCILGFIPSAFFASRAFVWLPYLVFAVGLLWFFGRKDLKFGLLLFLIPFVTLVFLLGMAFEESYCWGKGDQVQAEKGITTEDVSAEVADKYAKYMGTEPQHKPTMLGVAFMAHMDCHETFSWKDALFDTVKNPRF